MLPCCGVASLCARTSTSTASERPGCKIIGANEPTGPPGSIVAGVPFPFPASGVVPPDGVVPSAGSSMTDDDPSGPITIVVSPCTTTLAPDPLSADLDELLHATNSTTHRSPANRCLFISAILTSWD